MITLDKLIAVSQLTNVSEVEKALHFAFYHLKKTGVHEFSAGDAAKWIHDAHLGNPNVSRLGAKLKASGDTVRASANMFKLHHSRLSIARRGYSVFLHHHLPVPFSPVLASCLLHSVDRA